MKRWQSYTTQQTILKPHKRDGKEKKKTTNASPASEVINGKDRLIKTAEIFFEVSKCLSGDRASSTYPIIDMDI